MMKEYKDGAKKPVARPTTLYIAPNCGLDLKLNQQYNKDFGVEYKVGNINDFPNITDNQNQQETTGWLSPMQPVTLPPEAKSKAGIPTDAMSYAYVYPPRGLADNIDWENVSPTSDDISHISDENQTNKWALPYVATFGAYAYFDENRKLLSVNALTLEKTDYVLNFEGPFVATKDSYREIYDLYRYQSLYLDSFGELGFIGLAWIDPKENAFIDTEVQGQSQSHVQNHHGGFLYFRHDKTAVLFLVESAKFPMDTPSHGVEAPIIDAFRLCKHELQTKSLSTTCPTTEQRAMEIHRACEDGSKGHVSHFLSKNTFNHKSVLLVQDTFGWTPLHYACCYHANDDDLIEMLLNANSEAALVKSINNTYPIHLACQNGHLSLKTAELLIKHGQKHSTIHAKSKHYEFLPLHFACSNDQTPVEVIRTLLLHSKETVHEKTKFDSTPLYMAIASNHSHEVIDILLRFGSESQTSSPGKTNPILLQRVNGMLPIHLACLKGCSIDIVSLLLEADVEDKCFYSTVEECTEYDLMNSTILHIALAHSPTDVIKLLLLKEVKARCKPSKKIMNLLSVAERHGGMFPIHIACARKDLGIDTIKTLLRLERASISFEDSAGNKPLHHICNNKDVDENLVELLLKTEEDYVSEQGKFFYKIDQLAVKTYNKKGETPLHVAVKNKASGAHALLRPEQICLKGMGGEGKDKFVELVLASNNKEVQNNVVANLAERQYFTLIFLELVANIVATIIYFEASIATVNGVRAIQPIESIALITCTVIFILRELIQVKSTSLSGYFSDGWNWIECASIAALVTATVHMIQLRESPDGEHGGAETRMLFTSSGVLLLLQFMFIVRTTFLPFARFIAGLIAILVSLIPFLVVSVMLLLIFTYSYVISGRRTEECPDFGVCLFWTLEGFFYGMDGFAVTPILDTLFGLIAVVILLNVVIAIVSDTWSDSVNDTREVFWQSRVEILFQYRMLKSYIGTDSFFGPLFAYIDKVELYGNQMNKKSVDGKTSFLRLLISFTANVFWFVLGLVTFGLFWPRKLRQYILSAGMNS